MTLGAGREEGLSGDTGPVPGDELAFRRLLEGVPGVLYLDEPFEGGRVLYLSPSIEDMLGYRPDELLVGIEE